MTEPCSGRLTEENFKSFALQIDAAIVEVFLVNYSNRLFVGITQTGTLGTFISVRRGRAVNVEEETEDVYETKCLFGDDRLECHAAARTLAETLQTEKPILFALSIPQLSFNTIRLLRKAFEQHRFQ